MILDSSPDRERQFVFLGALSGLLCVALGAFGAHVLRDVLHGHRMEVFKTAVHWQAVHALALLATGLWCGRRSGPLGPAAGWLFAAGTVIFCGSLYAFAATGVRAFGAVTPFGGVAWLAGWACLAVAALRRRAVEIEVGVKPADAGSPAERER